MEQTCKQCGVAFTIEERDLVFYKKVSPTLDNKKLSLAPPSLCPDCRRRRKLAWRNEQTIYRRTCDLCKNDTISIHAPDHPYPVYCNTCYWSDDWDPLSFGKTFDPTRSFLEQFYELYKQVPQRAMVNENGITSENCEYTIDVPFARNCYMCAGMWEVENCYYCRICDQSKYCVDCEGVKLGSELVYDSVDSQKLYRCRSLQNSENSRDCIFGYDLKGCSDCVACFGLRQKQYHIFNQQYSREHYEEKLNSYRLDTYAGVESLRKEYEAFIARFPRKNMNLQNCEESFGDHLFHCRDVIGYSNTHSEHSRWIERCDGPLWSYDQVQSGKSEWCLECITVDNGYNNICAVYCNQSKFVLYSENCFSCESLLGCISLRKNKHCILNVQYSEEEYDRVAAQAIERMQEDSEFGEFFSIEYSPYGYNETNAMEFYPMEKDAVLENGWKWADTLPYTTGKETVDWDAVPESIDDVTDTTLREIFACEGCSRNFRIVAPELRFYQDLRIPLPQLCPACRNQSRLSRRNPEMLFGRQCAKCDVHMQTTYPPSHQTPVYCESCYLEAVY